MRTVTTEERRARLGRRNLLAGPAADPVEAARAMVGLHSSDPATPYLSVWARVPGFETEHLERALYEDRSLIRMLGMRRTMWVVPRDLAPVLHHSSTVALVDRERRRHVKMIEEGGIAENGEIWADRVSAATLGALQELGEATASELVRLIPELGEKVTFYKKDGSVTGVAGMSTRTLFLLAAEARVVRARPLGSWLSSQYRWTTMKSWLGEDLASTSASEASESLLERWLLSFGPGTEVDMKWWTGWPVSKVRQSLRAFGAVEVDLDGTVGYLHPNDTAPVSAPEPWVALLPSLDPTTMGWKERVWYLGDLGAHLFDRNGNAGPTVWADGRIVGGWGQRPDGDIGFEIMVEIDATAQRAISDRARQLQTWLGQTRIIPRFTSPHEKLIRGVG